MAVPPAFWRSPRLRPVADWFRHLGQPIAVATVAVAALVLGGRSLGLLQGMELAAYDQLLRSRPAAPPDDRLLVVGITEADIQSRQEWPMTDQTLVETLQVILAAEPRVVALDIFRDVPMEPGRAALLDLLAADNPIVTVCKINSVDNSGIAPPPTSPPEQVGFSDLPVDPGGTLRRHLVAAGPPDLPTSTGDHLCNTPGTQLFSLGLQLALVYLTVEGYPVGQTPDQQIQVGESVLPRLDSPWGGYRQVDAAGYQIMLNYRGQDQGVPQVSLGEVLAGTVPPEQIRDRIVLIGTVSPEAKDMFYTPYSGNLRDSQQMPGVIVHAQATSQILSAALDGRSLIWVWPGAIEGLWIVGWTLAGAIFATYVRRPWVFVLGGVGAISGLYGLCYGLLLTMGGWIPLIPAAVGMGLAAVGVVLVDRVNRSAYGQAVYRQVKSFLRLKIEIDEDQVERQVAEITESSYFNQLQQRAKNLRHQRDGAEATPQADNAAPPGANGENGDALEPPTAAYLDALRAEGQRFKQRQADTQTPPEPSDPPPQEDASDP